MGLLISLKPSTPIVPGTVGRISVAVALDAVYADGGQATWVTPPSCSVTLTSNACAVPTATAPNLYVLSGTGTCTQPAKPFGTNTAGAVTIGDFSFALEFEPSSDP
jgi:hypothetical protein